MKHTDKSVEIGRKDAEEFIRNERIDYEPFVALSDMELVHNLFAIDYEAMKKTVETFDGDLWQEIDASAAAHSKDHGEDFNFDSYARGFIEGVAIVWEKIRGKV